MNPRQYLKDYYSNSSNDSIMDQLKNFGSETGGGKAAINGIVTGLTSPVRAVAEGFTKGTGALANKVTGRDYSNITNKKLNDINNFFTNDSLTDSVNENPIIDTIANYGTSLAAGSAISKTPSGIIKAGSNLPKGINSGINKIGILTDGIINKSIANEANKTHPLTLNTIGSSILNGIGNVVKQPAKAGVYALNAFNNSLANTDISKNRINNRTQQQLNSVDNFFKY